MNDLLFANVVADGLVDLQLFKSFEKGSFKGNIKEERQKGEID